VKSFELSRLAKWANSLAGLPPSACEPVALLATFAVFATFTGFAALPVFVAAAMIGAETDCEALVFDWGVFFPDFMSTSVGARSRGRPG